MNLFNDFCKEMPNRLFVGTLLGGLAASLYAFLIPIVIVALETTSLENDRKEIHKIFSIEVSNIGFAKAFFLICGLIFLTRLSSRIILQRAALEFSTNVRIKLYRLIARTPILTIEELGSSKLLGILTRDVGRIISVASSVPSLFFNLITIIGTLGFVAFQNSATFYFLLIVILFSIITYQIPIYLGFRVVKKSNELGDDLHKAIYGLVFGAKELKLDICKSKVYFNQTLVPTEVKLLENTKKSGAIYLLAAIYGDMIGFLTIGIVAFLFLNYYPITSQEMIGIVMSILYLTGPIANILGILPDLANAKASIQRVQKLIGEMTFTPLIEFVPEAPCWERMELKNVMFNRSTSEVPEGFNLGPIDLVINKGEITFIVGGNGSGKSTLSKIISLHYCSYLGTIFFDKQRVSSMNIQQYRGGISTIFSDYYLFDNIMSEMNMEKTMLIQKYLLKFGLQHKVSVDGGKFSTLSLSDGQKKRLALLVAMLDDKQLYIFDEWAADQDPEFKEVFYQDILPEFKLKGKAIVVISHDDRYFSVADKLITLDEGKIRLNSKGNLTLKVNVALI